MQRSTTDEREGIVKRKGQTVLEREKPTKRRYQTYGIATGRDKACERFGVWTPAKSGANRASHATVISP